MNGAVITWGLFSIGIFLQAAAVRLRDGDDVVSFGGLIAGLAAAIIAGYLFRGRTK